MESPLNYKLREYHNLKTMRDYFDKRIATLRDQIITEVQAGNTTFGNYSVELQERDRTSFDESRVHDTMQNKGFKPESYCIYRVEPAYIEELYYQGYLTDDDLRYIREPKRNIALVVKENVQGMC